MVVGADAPEAQLTVAKRNGIEVWSEDQFEAAVLNDEAEAEDERARLEGRATTRGGSAAGELRFPGACVRE